MARNSMQMVYRSIPNQLVFGINPKLPNVMNESLPALEGKSFSETLNHYLEVLHKARTKWKRMHSEALLKAFKGFNHFKAPVLTASYMQYILKHRKLPKQYMAYEQFLGIYYEESHFYGLIICLRSKTLFTVDGLNKSQNPNHNINKNI